MSLVTCQNIQTGDIRTIAQENASTACGRIQVRDPKSGAHRNYPPVYRRLQGEELIELTMLKNELLRCQQVTNNKAAYDYNWAVGEVNAKLQTEEDFLKNAPRLLASPGLKQEHRKEIQMLQAMLLAGQGINQMRKREAEIKVKLRNIGTEYRMELKKQDREAGIRALLAQEKVRIDMQAELDEYAEAKPKPKRKKKKSDDDSDPGDQGS